MRGIGRREGSAREAGDEFAGALELADDPEDADDQPDTLLACLDHLASHFGLAFSARAALAGLPLVDGRLTPSLFPRAATRVGLDARLVRGRPSRVPAFVAPFVAIYANGDAAVVLEVDRRRKYARLVMPAASARVRKVPLRKLDDGAVGHVLYVTPLSASALAETDTTVRDPASTDRWFWPVVWSYWPSWVMVVLAALLVNLLALALPLFIMNVFDRVIPNLAIPTLWALTAGIAIALLFDFSLKLLRTALLNRTGQRIEMRVSASIFEHLLSIRSAHLRAPSGRLVNAVREFETVRDVFTSSGLVALTDFLFIGIFIAVLSVLVGPLVYVLVAAVPIVLGFTLLVQLPLTRSIRRSMRETGDRQSILVESLVGLGAIRANAAEGGRQRAWERATAATARASSRAKFWASLATGFTGVAMQTVSVVIIAWGVVLVMRGEITIGALVAANILGSRALSPLANIVQTLARGQQALGALRTINELMRQPGERHGRRGAASGRAISRGALAFERVSFTYPDAAGAALATVSFQVDPGERVGIIGNVGAGKSTLGRLAAGFYDCDEGTVLVDDLDVRQYDTATLRHGVALVEQDAMLFQGTIRDNILMGEAHASARAFEEAAEISGVDAFARYLPLGYDSPVAERGANLSGGQKQAIALARALVRKPRILFLDEPTSAMDRTAEARFIAGLDRLSTKRHTILVATHKTALVRALDRLVVLDRGRVVLDGARDEVLATLGQMAEKGTPRAVAGPDGREVAAE